MQLKEKDEQLRRTHEEAKNYQAKYHEAESKRLAAIGHVQELKLATDGKGPRKKAWKVGIEEKCRIKDHLVQTDNDVRFIKGFLYTMNTNACLWCRLIL